MVHTLYCWSVVDRPGMSDEEISTVPPKYTECTNVPFIIKLNSFIWKESWPIWIVWGLVFIHICLIYHLYYILYLFNISFNLAPYFISLITWLISLVLFIEFCNYTRYFIQALVPFKAAIITLWNVHDILGTNRFH